MQNFLNVLGNFFTCEKRKLKLDYEEASARKWGGWKTKWANHVQAVFQCNSLVKTCIYLLHSVLSSC